MEAKQINSNSADRARYFHGLRILVGGTRQVESEKLNQEIDTEVFRSCWNSRIWLELQVSRIDKNLFMCIIVPFFLQCLTTGVHTWPQKSKH